MSEKSFVSVEMNICPVCGVSHETGALLMDRRLRDQFERTTATGYSLCPEHLSLHEQGYVALVECDQSKSKITKGPNGDTVKPGDEYRTGNIAHVRRAVAEHIFNVPIGDTPVMFIEIGVIDRLREMSGQ